MTHTRGPWELRGSRLVTDSNGVVIAEKISANYPGTPEDNATLIAAAPELLHELKRELDWLVHIRPQVTAPDSVMLGFDQAIKYISNAIAKAEGGIT